MTDPAGKPTDGKRMCKVCKKVPAREHFLSCQGCADKAAKYQRDLKEKKEKPITELLEEVSAGPTDDVLPPPWKSKAIEKLLEKRAVFEGRINGIDDAIAILNEEESV